MRKKNPNRNDLKRVRKKRKLERKQVAYLLKQSTTDVLRCQENAQHLPNLRTALKLEIIYQMPIKLLFSEIYKEMRAEINELRKQYPERFPDSLSAPDKPEQLLYEEFCFYSELLKNGIPNALELAVVDKHVLNILGTTYKYKGREHPYLN